VAVPLPLSASVTVPGNVDGVQPLNALFVIDAVGYPVVVTAKVLLALVANVAAEALVIAGA